MKNYKNLAKRDPRTKADLLAEIDSLSAKLSAKPKATPVQAAAQAKRNTEVVQKTKDTTPSSVAQSVANLKVSLDDQLRVIMERMTLATEDLETVKEAIAIKQGELEEIYDKETVLRALDELLVQFENERQQHEQFMADSRDNWAEEQARHQADIAERNRVLKLTRDREQEEYEYEVAKARRANQDTFDTMVRNRQREEEARQAQLNKVWEQTNADLVARAADLDTREAALEETLETARKTAEKEKAMELNSLKRDYTHAEALAVAKSSADIARLEDKVTSLQQQLDGAIADNGNLRTQLAAAEERVQAIATSAISGSGQALALSELKHTLSQPQVTNGKKN